MEEKITAQAQYCQKNKVPRFAPMDGVCFACRKQIYERITLEEASRTHITDCPFCHRSYCD